MPRRFILRVSVGQETPTRDDAGFTATGYSVEVDDGEPDDAKDEIVAVTVLAHWCERRILYLLREVRLVDV